MIAELEDGYRTLLLPSRPAAIAMTRSPAERGAGVVCRRCSRRRHRASADQAIKRRGR
jgi:hypothetical protein